MSECQQNILIDYASHAIGLDYKRPYIRHGKKFYKPYRNYYDTFTSDKVWLRLEKLDYAKSYGFKIIDGCEHISFILSSFMPLSSVRRLVPTFTTILLIFEKSLIPDPYDGKPSSH